MSWLPDQRCRTATVRADTDSCIDGSTECFRLHRRDVHHLLASDKCAAALAEARTAYDQRAAARESDRVNFVVEQFFEILAIRGETIVSSDGTSEQLWGVSQGGYSLLHMLVTKVLPSGLSDEDAKLSARSDWAEDVVSFETGDRVNVALEVTRASLRNVVESAVQREGWAVLGDVRIDGQTFVGVCREELGVLNTDLDDQTLTDLFMHAESSVVFGAGLSGPEFASWLSRTVCDDGERAVRTPIRSAAISLQKVTKAEIMKYGWEHAFSRYSTDGLGELRFEEFAVLVQELGADPTAFPRSVLRQIFRHLDSSRSSKISSAQIFTWIENAPVDQLMPIQSFKEGLLQLSQLWGASVNAVDAKSPDRDDQFLQWLLEAITCLDGDGGDDGRKRRLRRLDEIEEADSPQDTVQPAQATTPNSPADIVPLESPVEPPMSSASRGPRPSPPTTARPPLKARGPLFVSPRMGRASPQCIGAKDFNPNRIFYSKPSQGAWTSTCNGSRQHGQQVSLGAMPSVVPQSHASTESQQGDELSAVASKVADQYTGQKFASNGIAHAAAALVATNSCDQWSTKHYQSSSRQAQRTTGSGRLLGRTEHASSPRVVNITVRPNTCCDLSGPAYIGGNDDSAPSPGVAREVPSKHVSLSASVEQAQLSKRGATTKDIVFNRMEVGQIRLRGSSRPASWPTSSCNVHGSGKQPDKGHVMGSRQRPATAPVRRGTVERSEADHKLEQSSTWLTMVPKEQGPKPISDFAGIRQRTRPEAIARLHLMGVESRGPMRLGRPIVLSRQLRETLGGVRVTLKNN